MASVQSQYIRDLLVELLSRYNPDLDLSPTSELYRQVVSPLYDAVSPDPFDTDIENFLITRLRQEYPSLEVQQGDMIVDLLVRPLQMLLEPFKRELQRLKISQSANYPDAMTLEDAEDLAANFFVERQSGVFASGSVRVYFNSPTFVTITPSVTFTSTTGQTYRAVATQTIRPDVLLLQRSGEYYYVDVNVIATAAGEVGNAAPNTITSVSGLAAAYRVTNPFDVLGGSDEESTVELLGRVRTSLTERSLTSKRGIIARLTSDFPSIRSIEVIGYGDPEMNRDVLSGTGSGTLTVSGMSFIFDKYMFLISLYEDRGVTGGVYPTAGDSIKLHYWDIMYPDASSRIEKRTIDEVIYSSIGDLSDVPTIYILRLDKSPDAPSPGTGGIPDTWPGVFASAFTSEKLEITGVPEGVYSEVEFPFEVDANKVHIGGRYDVFIRPSTVQESTETINIHKSKDILAHGSDLVSGGAPPTSLDTLTLKNKVELPYLIVIPGGSGIQEFEIIRDTATGVQAVVHKRTNDLTANTSTLLLTDRTGEFIATNIVEGKTSGATVGVLSVHQDTFPGDLDDCVLRITNGSSEGEYIILDHSGGTLLLNTDLNVTESELTYYIVRFSVIENIFDPRFRVFPVDEFYVGASTSIGSSTVELPIPLLDYDVRVGDSFDIMEGEDKGRYAIREISGLIVELESTLGATNSGLKFSIYRESPAIQAPLVRILPGGVVGGSLGGGGYSVPYGKPLGAKALQAFSGARGSYIGFNGFCIPDAGRSWQESDTFLVDLDPIIDADDEAEMLLYGQTRQGCFSIDCKEARGIVVVCTLTVDANTNQVKFWITGGYNTIALNYLKDLKTWLINTITQFFSSPNTNVSPAGLDLLAFVELFAPIYMGTPPLNETVVKQFEAEIPKELFDGCNNVYLAFPEFDWAAEFANQSFETAVQRFIDGLFRAPKPALCYAKKGDSLEVRSGSNAGNYVIDDVYELPIYHGDCIQLTTNTIQDSKAYVLAFVVIRGEFPNNPFKGAADFFSSGITQQLHLPVANGFQTIQAFHVSGPNNGQNVSPFEVIELGFTWLFQYLDSTGFNLPNFSATGTGEISINPSSVLKKITSAFFSEYVVGYRSCIQTVRNYFIEPTSFYAYSPRKCRQIAWQKGINTLPCLTSEWITNYSYLAITEGKKVSLRVSRGIGQETVTLEGEVPTGWADAAVAESIAVHNDPVARDTSIFGAHLAEALQTLLDPDKDYIEITTEVDTSGAFDIRLGWPVKLKFCMITGGQGAALGLDTAFKTSLDDAGFFAMFQDISIATDTTDHTTWPFPPTNLPVAYAEGVTELDSKVTTVDMAGNNGTLYNTTTSAGEFFYNVELEDYPEYEYLIDPKDREESGRNIVFSDDFLHPNDPSLNAQSCFAFFSQANRPTPLSLGVEPGDILYVHHQVQTLDPEGNNPDPLRKKKDRPIAVRCATSSHTLTLPENTSGSFLTPETGLEEDTVQAGDLVYFEEINPRPYIVASVADRTIELTEPAPTTTTLIYASGTNATISQTGTTFTVTNYTFTTQDIGRFICIYGSQYDNVDGAYEIVSVNGQEAEINTSDGFAESESGVCWVIAKSPISSIPDSQINGITALVGITPIRIYRGNAFPFEIAEVSGHLDITRAYIEILYEGHVDPSKISDYWDATTIPLRGPKRGFLQPYYISRPGTYAITSTAMLGQGKDRGLYYFDVPCKSLSTGPQVNVPKDTPMTPVHGTYKCYGYRLETDNPSHTYSERESTSLICTAAYLPAGLFDRVENLSTIEGSALAITYEMSTTVSDVQAMLTDEADRNLCADPLCRHFLPAYTYVEIQGTYSPASAEDIYEYIEGLSPTESLKVSQIERFLHKNNIRMYDHPIYLNVVTHDLNRHIILTQSSDLIDDNTILHDGTNRLTYFVPGNLVQPGDTARETIVVGGKIE